MASSNSNYLLNKPNIEPMTEHDKLKIAHARLLGEFQGTLEGIVWNDIPEKLKAKLDIKIKELDNTKNPE